MHYRFFLIIEMHYRFFLNMRKRQRENVWSIHFTISSPYKASPGISNVHMFSNQSLNFVRFINKLHYASFATFLGILVSSRVVERLCWFAFTFGTHCRLTWFLYMMANYHHVQCDIQVTIFLFVPGLILKRNKQMHNQRKAEGKKKYKSALVVT
jgi:hypothetical protein